MKCLNSDCPRPARVAIRTAIGPGQVAGVQTMVWWSHRDAAYSASRYCKAHGVELLASLAAVMITDDDETKEGT